ncbi:MAG: molecular chaperone HtpG [Candidatus Shikimatogenerans bostrichidophilus]|nr:MAG: molecular chaperone HtpG [Candidatus Shikimatogenerans bostrichidophilus]
MKKGNININTKKIFPILKNFLYSNNDIFIRELVSNANDAILKLKKIINIKKLNIDINSLKIDIEVDSINKTIKILDNGIGMSEKEIKKYINTIAFSGAEDFIKKYKDCKENIIGFFGLGFYSSFIVSDKVEIISKSYKKNKSAIHWICKGDIKFLMEKLNDKSINRGTKIILHINKNNENFLNIITINKLLQKYCNFLPTPIQLDNKIINNKYPIWIKNNITEEESKDFYHYLYKEDINDPILSIHLKTDYPFDLKGILYLPKIDKYMDFKINKIHIYQKQIFITNNIKDIIPDFLILLKGIIDSCDIPLNVSRSSIQYNNNIIKISNYIVRKICNKIEDEIKNNRNILETKWKYIETLVTYGIISNDYFLQNNSNIMLYYTVQNKFFTIEELKKDIINNKKQISKDNKIVILYCTNYNKQYNYIVDAINKGFKNIIIYNNPMFYHLIQKLEMLNNNLLFVSVDSDLTDIIQEEVNDNNNILIDKNKIEELKILIKKNLDLNENFNIKIKKLSSSLQPIIFTIPEFINRLKKINNFNNNKISNKYNNIIININNKIIKNILNEKKKEIKNNMLKNILNLYLILNNLLKGEKLNLFIKNLINELYINNK